MVVQLSTVVHTHKEDTTCEGAHAPAKPLNAAVDTAYEPVGLVTYLMLIDLLQVHNNMSAKERCNQPKSMCMAQVHAPVSPNHAGGQQQPSLYTQIVAHAAGNGLALAAAAIMLGLWRLLADVREPALWAAVCSVVLRDLKQALVQGGAALLHGRHAPLPTLSLEPQSL